MSALFFLLSFHSMFQRQVLTMFDDRLNQNYTNVDPKMSSAWIKIISLACFFVKNVNLQSATPRRLQSSLERGRLARPKCG